MEAYNEYMNKVLSSEKTYQRKDTEEDKDAIRAYLNQRDRTVPIHLPSLVAQISDAAEAGKALHSSWRSRRLNFAKLAP